MNVFVHLAIQATPEAESEDEGDVPVLMVCEVTHAYEGQYDDELSFAVGQNVEITADSEYNVCVCVCVYCIGQCTIWGDILRVHLLFFMNCRQVKIQAWEWNVIPVLYNKCNKVFFIHWIFSKTVNISRKLHHTTKISVVQNYTQAHWIQMQCSIWENIKHSHDGEILAWWENTGMMGKYWHDGEIQAWGNTGMMVLKDNISHV